MFFIKIKVKGCLKNLIDNSEEKFESIAIKNKNKISYSNMETIYKIEKKDNKLILIRDNKEFIHKFIFDIDNITKSEYYIKGLNTSIDVFIKTIEINETAHQIMIVYEIIDSKSKYIYTLDME